MDLRKVRRLTEVLLASELRSGRSLSDPRSLLGRPIVLAFVDLAAFLGVFSLTYLGANALSAIAPGSLDALAPQVIEFLPLISMSAVLLAGVMFEFSTTARFGSSDAANWLPIRPTEYVAASSLSVACVYSAALAFALGAGLGLALVTGQTAAFALSAGLSGLTLYEGALLIEMLRAATQRAAAVLSGRRGRVALAIRAVAFVLVILVFIVVFNPVLLLGLLGAFSGFAELTAVIPFFWATRAVLFWYQGAPFLATAFALAQVGLLAVLLYAAARVRVRFWAPSPGEVRLEAHRFGSGHPGLALVGLSPIEAALVSKDLLGLTRRREMLPILLVPVVVGLVGYLETATVGGGGFESSFWTTWVVGFFALMVSLTSIGQERRAILSLFGFPLTAQSFLRAKAATALLLSAAVIAAFSAAGAVLHRPPALSVAGGVVLSAAAALLGTYVGLAVATRYPDFQERPRPQFVRPGAMIAGMFGGLGLIFAIVIPATLWTNASDPLSVPALAGALVSAGAFSVAFPLLLRAARSGAEQMSREVPA